MAEQTVPGCRDPREADHPITITPAPDTIRVTFAGHTIAETHRALILREDGHPPIAYLPREDVHTEVLKATATRTRCPFKGEASYYDIAVEGKVADDAVWTYDTPCPAVAPVAAFLAFYDDQVTIEGVPTQ